MKTVTEKITAMLIAFVLIWMAPVPLYAQGFDPPQQNSNSDQSGSNADPTTQFGSNVDPTALQMDVSIPDATGMGQLPVMNMEPGSDSQRITLELKGVDVLDVLKILSSRSGLNIVAGKNVRGQVTIYLKDVLIQEALDTIVAALGLAYEEEQGIIKVMTDKEYEAMYGRIFRDRRVTKTFKIKYAEPTTIQQVLQQLKGPQGKIILDERTNTLIIQDLPEIIDEIENAISELDQKLVTKVYKLQYAPVEDLEEKLSTFLTPETGVIKIDPRTNMVTVTDREEKIQMIDEIVKAFDKRPKQVLIEAQIIEVQLYDAYRFGIDWDYVRSQMGQLKDVNIQPGYGVPVVPGSTGGGGTLTSITVGETGMAGLSNMVIRILQNVGKTNTLASPRLSVLNNEEAKLAVTTKEPYIVSDTTYATSGSSSVPYVAEKPEFVDVGVALSVVPTISDDNTIILKIKPEVSNTNAPDFEYDTAAGTVDTAISRSIPVVASQTLETTVIVKSGETIILGGLINDSESKTREKVPVLGDIPVIGALFRKTSDTFTKDELVIFLTPHIISGDASSSEQAKYLDNNGRLINFDKAGGYDFGLAQKHSQGAARIDNRPYWKIDKPKWPQYAIPPDVYTRSKPYADRMNEFEGGKEGKVIPPKETLIDEYQQQVGAQVSASLEAVEEIQSLEGNMDLALTIRRDGVLEEVSFIDVGPVKKRDVRYKILDAIKGAGQFPAFPKGLDSAKETLDLRFELESEKI